MNSPKILLLDIETMAAKTYYWGLYQEITSTEMQISDWYILCVCAKWLGKKEVFSFALPDFELYKKEPENDIEVLKAIHSLLDEADIVVAHNGKKFDIRKLYARFITQGLKPPSPYKVVDTCLEARRIFAFTSNRLNDLAKVLKLGQKVKHEGFTMWRDCAKGILSAWKKMVQYCKGDVVLLEKIYLRLLPYLDNHPNLTVYIDDHNPRCPNCGSKNLIQRGFAYTKVGKFHQYRCKEESCGRWSRGRTPVVKQNKPQIV